MPTEYVYLKFPELENFVKYLKEHRIHCYGIVQRSLQTKHHLRLFFRLTAINPDKEIIVCEVDIWKGLAVDFEKEEYRKRKEPKLNEVLTAFKGDYQFTQLDAEFQLKLENEV
jgi:hypothetical protein